MIMAVRRQSAVIIKLPFPKMVKVNPIIRPSDGRIEPIAVTEILFMRLVIYRNAPARKVYFIVSGFSMVMSIKCVTAVLTLQSSKVCRHGFRFLLFCHASRSPAPLI